MAVLSTWLILSKNLLTAAGVSVQLSHAKQVTYFFGG